MPSARKNIVFFWTAACASCGTSVSWDFRFRRKTRNPVCTSIFMILPMLATQAIRKLWPLRQDRKKRRPIENTNGTLDHVSDLPSRAADHIFWLGRYAERCEHLARMLRCILVRLTGESGAPDESEWESL